MRKSRTGKVPQFVSGQRAAAELDLSLSTFLTWVRDGLLPPPEGGSPPSSPRWLWSRIEKWIGGDRSDKPINQAELFPPHLAHGHRKRGRKPGSGGRPRQPPTPAFCPISGLPEEIFSGHRTDNQEQDT
jgi:hypothetical protein